MCTMKQHESFERRVLPRRRVLKGGTITSKRLNFSTPCTIRNLSTKGACLTSVNATYVPLEFELTLDDGTVRPCRIIWRHSDRLGVSFQESIGAAAAGP
jgi:PilZ domain